MHIYVCTRMDSAQYSYRHSKAEDLSTIFHCSDGILTDCYFKTLSLEEIYIPITVPAHAISLSLCQMILVDNEWKIYLPRHLFYEQPLLGHCDLFASAGALLPGGEHSPFSAAPLVAKDTAL